jgi:hypothetical protein
MSGLDQAAAHSKPYRKLSPGFIVSRCSSCAPPRVQSTAEQSLRQSQPYSFKTKTTSFETRNPPSALFARFSKLYSREEETWLIEMCISRTFALVGVFIVSCLGQGQPPGNVPIKICSWAQFRAAMVRDKIYIDGGVEYLSAMNSGPWATFQSTVYLNLTIGFNLVDNLTELLTPLLSGTPLLDSFYSGYMFADYYQFYTYGGLPSPEVFTLLPEDYVFRYVLFENSPGVVTLELGPIDTKLPSNINRYITDGAGVSIPSEDLGFYFGGMTNSDKVNYDGGTAQKPSDTLVKVNMSTAEPTWSHTELPASILSRADAQLVWIPVSESGLLIALGGVINPESLFFEALNSSQVSDSEAISPSFMNTIPIYDVASEVWFIQEVAGSYRPGQLTGFCAVLATENQSSFDIYIHGGYNGVLGFGAEAVQPNNDVWVFSVPSFTWTKVHDGNLTQGRRFHSCFAPYPDQMLVIGGVGLYGDDCVDSIIKIFNLNTLEWQSGYDPLVWSEYARPPIVSSAIAAAGSITWSEPELPQLFNTLYKKPILVYYPYVSGSIAQNLEKAAKQALASWLGGLLGIVLYLFLSTICLFAIVILRRRMLLQRGGAAPLVSTAVEKSRFIRWINNMKVDTEERKTLMNEEEDELFVDASALSKYKARAAKKFFGKISKSIAKQEPASLRRQEKSTASGEAYELRTRGAESAGYAPISTEQEGQRPLG